MQTFFLHPHYAQSTRLLDTPRLNNQVNEGLVILTAVIARLEDTPWDAPWYAHPATRAWYGHPGALIVYIQAHRYELHLRGIHDSRATRLANVITHCRTTLYARHPHIYEWPWWAKDSDMLMRMIASHRANLFHKDPVHYRDFAEEYEAAKERGIMDPRFPNKPQYVWPCESREAYAAYREKGRTA